MAWNVYPKQINGHTYYYAQRSVREKVEAKKDGTRRQSKVRSETLYLGTAETIVNKFKSARKPIEARHRDFGFVTEIGRAHV